MSSAGAHTDERCRQPAFLPGPPPPQEVESSSGSAKVSSAPRCPPRAGHGGIAGTVPGRAAPCRAARARLSHPDRAGQSRAGQSRAVPTRVTRGTPSAGPGAGGGAAPLRWVRGVSRGPSRPPAAMLPAAVLPAGPCRRGPAWGGGSGGGGGAAVRGPGRGYARSRSERCGAPAARGAPSARGGCGSGRRAGRAPAVLRLRRPAR